MDTRITETAERQWRIEIGALFDIEAARACLRQCRNLSNTQPRGLLFDLTRTRSLHTAGIGAMMHIKSTYLTERSNAVIVFHDQSVGEILHLARLDRLFELRTLERGQARTATEKTRA